MTSFEIWAEGYRATGESGDATYLGTSEGESFDEAVKLYKDRNPSEAHLLSRNGGYWTYWACRLYDNEQQARLSYG